MKATISKITILAVLLLTTLFGAYAEVYNSEGDFSVEIDKRTKDVINDNIVATFEVEIENKADTEKEFSININDENGWDIIINPATFKLQGRESKTVSITFQANSDFDYSEDVVSPNEIVISQKSDYRGSFEFPVTVSGEDENVLLRLKVEIYPIDSIPLTYDVNIADGSLSPVKPLRFSVGVSNIYEEKTSDIQIKIGNEVIETLSTTFTPDEKFKIFEVGVPNTFEPKSYDVSVIINQKKGEGNIETWYDEKTKTVVPYSNIDVTETQNNFLFGKETIYKIENNGNTKDTFEKSIPLSFFGSFFFSSSHGYERQDGNALFSEELNRGETITLETENNYLALFIIIFVIAILVIYSIVRKSMNPLDLQIKIYDVKRVKHEGLKELKLQVDFENIKEKEIEVLKLVFRLPTYLRVKEHSFLLTPPKHVLKGKNQYKLEWEFRRFETGDSRILGFTLVNNRGILGDIRLGDIELDVKINGKTRKYYKTFPIIRG